MVTQFQNMVSPLAAKLQLYTDNPRQLVLDARARRLKAMRQALVGKLPTGVKPENIVVDDEIEIDARPVGRPGQVRRLFFSRLALHAAARVEARHRARMFIMSLCSLLFCSATIAYFAMNPTGLASKYAMYALSFSMILWGFWAAWRFLGVSADAYSGLIGDNEVLTSADMDDAKCFAERVLVRAVPADAPADLQDIFRPLTIDAEGQAVDAQVVPNDFEGDYLAKALSEGQEIYLLIAAAFLLSGIVGVQSTLSGVTLALLLALLATGISAFRVFKLPGITEERAIQSENAYRASPNARLIEQVGQDYFASFERAREQQIKAASIDSTPFIQLGISTGQFAERRDPLAPSQKGIPFGLTVHDLSTHLFVPGRTGAGKTSSVLRPVLYGWVQSEAGGVLVLDGKGVLPGEVADLDGFEVVTPGQATFAMIENLAPDAMADVIYEVYRSKEQNGNSAFFEGSARELLAATGKVLAIMVNSTDDDTYRWTAEDVYKLLFDPAFPPRVCEWIEGDDNAFSKLEGDALRAYIAFKQIMIVDAASGSNSRGDILKTLHAWLSPLVNNSLLTSWASADRGVQIEDVLHGKKLGLLLDKDTYGKAGEVISKLAKKRFYQAVLIRKETWKTGNGTRALLMMDECQDLVTADEVEILPKCRSMGLSCVFATQNIEGLEAALKSPEATKQLLDCFPSVVALKTKSSASCQFVAEAIGAVSRAIQTEVPAPVTDAASTASLMQAQSGAYKSGTLMASATSSPDVRKFRKNGLLPEVAVKAASAILQPVVRELVQPEQNQKSGSVKLGCHEIITAAEVPSLTAEQFTAIAIVNRAGVERRDKINLTPMFSFPKGAK